MSLIQQRMESHGDPWTTARNYNADDPLAYPRDMQRAKLARILSGGLHWEHICDLYEYAVMERDFTTRLERQGK